MIKVNQNFLKLKDSYLFSKIAKKIKVFKENNPQKKIISLGIGDVTKGLCPVCIEAFSKAVLEMKDDATFRGYGPEQGYDFLRKKIAENDFQKRGADIDADEIFISDGAKCDTANIQELFSQDIKIAVSDPIYPVYVDSNVMAGRSGDFSNERYEKLLYIDLLKENNFVPKIPDEKVDLIYLCSPNNPTGTVLNKDELSLWVDYAKDNKALILFDAAYEAFIQDDNLPHSIFEIKGAREVAIEFRSLSKTAGFTGTRLAYAIIPKECRAYDEDNNKIFLHSLWLRRQSTKFNGVSYPVQRAAEAVFTSEGKKQITKDILYYLNNASIIRKMANQLGYFHVGGEHSPYVWIDVTTDSWEFFEFFLNETGIVCTPGAGFGKCGESYVRFSSFNSLENVNEAVKLMENLINQK